MIEKINSDLDYMTQEYLDSNRARFEAYRYYIKCIDPDNADDWFDQEVIDKYESNKQNVRFNIKQANIDFISTTRVPTRCVHCKRVWAVEIQDGKGIKFEKNFLDQSLYKNIPCVKGDCIDAPDCKEYK
jgi:hypothetical protein